MPTVTIEADVELDDIDNRDLIEEFERRIRKKMFSHEELVQLTSAIKGHAPKVSICDYMIAEALDDALKVYSPFQIIDKLKIA